MSFDVKSYRIKIHSALPGGTNPQLVDMIADVLSRDLRIVTEINADAAVAMFGNYRYQVSVPKLAAGLASVASAVLDPTLSGVFVGLGIVTAIATLSDSIRSITMDEGAICQALYEAKRTTGNSALPKFKVLDQLAVLTGLSNQLDERYKSAVSRLEGAKIVETNIAQDHLILQEIVFVGRKQDTKRKDI